MTAPPSHAGQGATAKAGRGVLVWAIGMTLANLVLVAALLQAPAASSKDQGSACTCQSDGAGEGPRDRPPLERAPNAAAAMHDEDGQRHTRSSTFASSAPELEPEQVPVWGLHADAMGPRGPGPEASSAGTQPRGMAQGYRPLPLVAPPPASFPSAMQGEGAKPAGPAGPTPQHPEGCTAPAYPLQGPNSQWHAVKQIPPPEPCRIQGFVIEALEPELNFRRPYALGLVKDVEDKQHLLPFLRAFQDQSLATRTRRVLLDLGGNFFRTSTLWFLRNYPLDFTELHVFESVKGRFRKPAPSTEPLPEDLHSNLNVWSRVKGAGAIPLPDWVLDRIHVYEAFVDVEEKEGTATDPPSVNITAFIKDKLNLTRNDAVIVKMDIEMMEWKVLSAWMRDPEMPYIVDDLFVESHYKHFSMTKFHWTRGPPREQALILFQNLRKKGFFAHPWP